MHTIIYLNNVHRIGISEGGVFCVLSADAEGDTFSFAKGNICCSIECHHIDDRR